MTDIEVIQSEYLKEHSEMKERYCARLVAAHIETLRELHLDGDVIRKDTKEKGILEMVHLCDYPFIQVNFRPFKKKGESYTRILSNRVHVTWYGLDEYIPAQKGEEDGTATE